LQRLPVSIETGHARPFDQDCDVLRATSGKRRVTAQDETGQSVPIVLTINGTRHALQVEPWTSLLDLLRERLKLTGTKKGCDHGQCGACTVLVDGYAIETPRLLLMSANGRFPDGLANRSGLVGKYLMVQLNQAVWGTMEEEIRWYKGPDAGSGANSSSRRWCNTTTRQD